MINIVDSIMGGGKTSWCIQHINENPDRLYIFVTPFLSEIQRIKEACPAVKFCEPLQLGEGKLSSFHQLITEGRNIATTHVLFSMATQETRDLLEAQSYTLIVDEALTVLEEIALKKHDLKNILEHFAHVDDRGYLIWDDAEYDGRFNDIKHVVNNFNVFVSTVGLVKIIPPETFSCFQEVYVLTYMFEPQIQRAYFDLFGVLYDYWKILRDGEQYKLIQHDFMPDDTSNIKINICQSEKLNAIGDKETALSKTWYQKNERTGLKVLKNHAYNYFHNVMKSSSEFNMWTAFKKYRNKVKGKGYAAGFLPANARATNEYKDRTAVAYLINRYVRPSIEQFFSKHGVKIDEDQFALSEMLQFVFRSAVREGKEINLYIPSRRMRTLLINWLTPRGC